MLSVSLGPEHTLHVSRRATIPAISGNTLGLKPSQLKRHLPPVEFVHPDQFARYKEQGMRLGFRYVASGPLVRSSYKAWEAALA